MGEIIAPRGRQKEWATAERRAVDAMESPQRRGVRDPLALQSVARARGTRDHLSKKRAKFMIFGAHVILYSKDATADRAFFRDVLGFASVDAGHGWLIFALPPAEAAVHPSEENERHELYFMCDDLKAEISVLGKKGVRCSDVQEARWGSITKIRLPSGGEVGLYQPKHPTALAR
jgi:catechol 2,3-dioxygenase-like lactoylglutathione lyase family enzyme